MKARSLHDKTKRAQKKKILERDVEGAVVRFATSLGWLVRKFSSPNHVSVPDRIFLLNAFTFFVEFKAPGKKPTEKQLREHQKMREVGHIVLVVDNVEHGKNLIVFITRLIQKTPASV